MTAVFVFLLPFLQGFSIGVVIGFWVKPRWWAVTSAVISEAGLLLLCLWLVTHAFRSAQQFVHLLSTEGLWLVVLYALPSAVGGWVGSEDQARRVLPQGRRVGVSAGLGILSLLILFIMLGPTTSSRREKAPRANCASNLRQIGLSLEMYADMYGGHLPPADGAAGLNELARVTSSQKLFHCPEDRAHRVPDAALARSSVSLGLTEDTLSYVYHGGFVWDGTNSDQTPLCWEKSLFHKAGLNVLFLDGHVEWISSQRWSKRQPE
jgi:prepilin-type processing-associated H-X9-DG protein